MKCWTSKQKMMPSEYEEKMENCVQRLPKSVQNQPKILHIFATAC